MSQILYQAGNSSGLGEKDGSILPLPSWKACALSTVIGFASLAYATAVDDLPIGQSGSIAVATWAMTSLAVTVAYKVASVHTAAHFECQSLFDKDHAEMSDAVNLKKSRRTANTVGRLVGCAAAALVGIPTLLASYHYAAKEYREQVPIHQSVIDQYVRPVSFAENGDKVIVTFSELKS